VESNFAAVIIFAIFVGIALGGVVFRRGITIQECSLVVVLTDLSDMFLALINMVISATPFAVFSLIANAVGSQGMDPVGFLLTVLVVVYCSRFSLYFHSPDDLAGAFSNVGWLIAASLTGFLAHICITDIGLLYFLAKVNPFEYLSYIVPAQVTALSCASSAATLPVTMQCVKNTGRVPDTVRNFVCPLGATVNMDGSAIYFPCACVWLAYLNGIEPDAAQFILLVILSTVGSVGTAPVPSSALVLIITAYNTVFNTSGTPNGFEFIVSLQWKSC
jgi:Na+/H+-dicarboxylate symporter